MDRAFKGIWIPKEIWLSKDLTIMEKIFLVEIDSLDNEEGCFASNEYFSNFFNLSKNRCSEIIKSLEKKEYLNISYKYVAGTKCIEKRVLKVTDKFLGVRDFEGGYSKNRQRCSENRQRYSEKCEDNNINNNTVNILKKEKETSLDKIIKEYTSNDNLANAIVDFIKMRKSIKKPLTDRALKLIINKLDTLSKEDQIKIEILEQSIEKCWSGVFPLKKDSFNCKEDSNSKIKTRFHNISERYNDYADDELERLLLKSQEGKFN